MDELDLDGDDATRPPMKHLPGLATEPSGDIPSPFRSRMSQRTRVLRLMGISVLLLLALAIPLASLPPTQRLVANVLHPATPTATPLYPPGVYPIWYINSVPWGVLRIDGRTGIRLTGVATLSGSTYQPPVFKLGKGRHTIRYDAPPYPPLNCTLSVPAAPGDTCPTGGGGLDLQASPEHLSAPLAYSLQTAVQAALDALLRIGPGAGAVVAPGEQYLGADGQLVTATVPLQAVLQYHLNADPGYPLPANVVATPCVMVCTDPNWVIVHASTDQLIGANVRVFWQYRSADGQQVVLDHAPGDRAQQAQTLVFLRVHWTSDHWLVQAGDGGDVPFSSALQTQPVCLVAGQSLGDLLSHYPASGQSWNELPSPQPAAGCVIFTRQLAGTPAVTGSGLLLLYRFGVLLAANDATHRLYHELPVATPAEQALAQQFATG